MDRTLTITIGPEDRAALTARVLRAVETGKYQGERLNFASLPLFFSKLTSNRWTLVQALQGAGETGVRELARRLGRDVRRVHDDASAMVDLGLIERLEDGKLACPYAEIHVDLRLRKAA